MVKRKTSILIRCFLLNSDENNKSKLARLSLLNEKVVTMKKQRETLVQDLRKKIEADDITKLVLMRRQENHKVRMKLFLIYSFLLS